MGLTVSLVGIDGESTVMERGWIRPTRAVLRATAAEIAAETATEMEWSRQIYVVLC